jgi:copper chaperone CopZ
MVENFQEEAIDIKGMHCKSCAEKIESTLSKTNGIDKARVSLVEEKAFVRFDPKKVDLSSIKKEIQSIGYETDAKTKGSVKQGIIYGLVPHVGCIAFIIASVLGVTAATEFFKPLMLNPYFFYSLVALSFTFATISSAFYLRKNGLLSTLGIKRKWKYLSTMYGSTIGVNLLLFLIIFPLLANVSVAQSPTGNLLAATNTNTLSSLKLQVSIPCSGHAPLITGELKKLDGVSSVKFSLPNVFDVSYDSSKTSKQQITDLEIFKTYKATVLDESAQSAQSITTTNSQLTTGTCGGSGGCGCGSGCGSGGGGCGCGG